MTVAVARWCNRRAGENRRPASPQGEGSSRRAIPRHGTRETAVIRKYDSVIIPAFLIFTVIACKPLKR